MRSRFVITGSGRCGTTWISRALTRAGVATGHEAVFNPWSPEWPDYLQGDSSWVAACELDRLNALGVPVALLVRHPLAVVKSLVEIGFFSWDTDNEYHQPLRAAYPEVYDWATPEDRALEAWVTLNSAALTRAELVLRFELVRSDPELFARLLRWTGVELNSGGLARYALQEPACNRHEESRERTGVVWEPRWEAHDLDLAGRAQALARILGYQDEED
jgi:hypothetical protein